MAVRLQMKLGVVAEEDRLQDSADTTVVVEPTVGSTTRSKGSLYVVVTGPPDLPRARDATRLVAETIRDEYFYDESAGIQVVLAKAVRSANRRLLAQRDRLGLGPVTEDAGPVGIGVAVVRSNELYVLTVGPVDAYLIRQARLLTLPDPHRERGLPTREIAPQVWRGEIGVGDTVALVSTNVTEKVGLDDLRDALVTLHPRSAMEHVHHRFIAADGTGSDGAIAFEAAEVASTYKRSELVPVSADDPLAGSPERSPIPLADSLSGGVAAVSGGASRAKRAAGGVARGGLTKFQDVLPLRAEPSRTVTPVATRRRTQRRLAVAALALIAVVAVLGIWVFMSGGGAAPPEAIEEVTAGQRALESAKESVRLVYDNGSDLVQDDPTKALQLLTNAYGDLQKATAAGIPAATIAPVQRRVVAGLDELYGMVDVAATQAFSFGAADPPVSIGAIIRGPDGAPFVLDSASHAVYRVDLKAKKASLILKTGDMVGSLKAGNPKFLAVGGPDLLILDSKNILWRWRAVDKKGNGKLARIRIADATDWGKDISAIGTFLRNADTGLYNLYVVDPSEKQILRYSPAADGSGFPAAATGYLAAPQDVSKISELYIDGDLWAIDGTGVTRFAAGQRAKTSVADPGDEILRPDTEYVHITGYGGTGEGVVYAWDKANRRVIATDKTTGEYIAQYRLADEPARWDDIRSMYVQTRSADLSPVLFWADETRLWTTPLEAIETPAAPSGSPGASPSGSAAPSRSDGEASPAADAGASPSAGG
jgi:hypothetical protein